MEKKAQTAVHEGEQAREGVRSEAPPRSEESRECELRVFQSATEMCVCGTSHTHTHAHCCKIKFF